MCMFCVVFVFFYVIWRVGVCVCLRCGWHGGVTGVRARAVGDSLPSIHGQPKLQALVHHAEGGGSGTNTVSLT